MHSLLTLKHLGALAQTADALQTVCQQLLSHGTKHAPLAALPQLWLDDLLSKLDNAFKQGWGLRVLAARPLTSSCFDDPRASRCRSSQLCVLSRRTLRPCCCREPCNACCTTRSTALFQTRLRMFCRHQVCGARCRGVDDPRKCGLLLLVGRLVLTAMRAGV